MEEIITFILGIWFGAFITEALYGIEKIMEHKSNEKININKIKISDNFDRVKPRKEKLNERIAYYKKTGEFYSPIVLNKDNVLIDGYISYLIAKKYGISEVKIERKKC